MTVTKGDDEPEIVVNAEPDAALATAIGVEEVKKMDGGAGGSKEPPIPVGHSRFYCEKCRSVSSAGRFVAPCNAVRG